MDLLNVVDLVKPGGMWSKIIFGLESSVGNYALALILITIIIKLVMIPFDFMNRYTSKKSSRKQMEMQPELTKINEKYANNKDLLNQKTMEVYKSHNFNVMGTCLGMVIYMAFSMTVFWTLFASLNNISAYKIADQYMQVRQEYYSAYNIDTKQANEKSEYDRLQEILNSETITDEEKLTLKTKANQKAKLKYDEVSTGFLWIENIWLADTAVNPVMDYKGFINTSRLKSEDIKENEYNLITEPIKNTARKNNGYFILVVLAAGLNYLSISMSTWISKAKAKKSGVDSKLMVNNSNKIMNIIMPLIMGLFTIFSNAAFGLYLVAGALMTFITTPLITLIVDKMEFNSINKEKNKYMPSYDRKRK